MSYKIICGIYKITNKINKKVYIGQSRNIKQRLNEHKNHLNRNIHHNSHLQNAWNKYGEINFKMETIEECPIEIINEKEKEYINIYKSYNRKYGYNIEKGGNQNIIVSEETRQKLRESNLKSYYKGEQCYPSKHTNEEIINCKKLMADGYRINEIQIKTGISKRTLHRIKNLECWKTIGSEYNKIIKSISFISEKENRIIQFDKCMNVIEYYYNPTEAYNKTGISISSICNSYSFKNICGGDYIWLKDNCDLENNIVNKKKELLNEEIGIIVEIDKYGDVINTFYSAQECATKLNLDSSTILKVCKGKYKSTKGHIFKKIYCKIN